MNISLELIGLAVTLLMILSLCLEHARLERQERAGHCDEPSIVERALRAFDVRKNASLEQEYAQGEHAVFEKPGFLQVTRSES